MSYERSPGLGGWSQLDHTLLTLTLGRTVLTGSFILPTRVFPYSSYLFCYLYRNRTGAHMQSVQSTE